MELFRNPHDALKFALCFSGQQYPQSQLAKNMKRSSGIGQGKGLVALDGAAQAGIIRARIERMTELQRACIVARFSARTEDCNCCGGQKMLAEYKEALLLLAQWADAFVSRDSSVQRLRFGIVQAYFDRKASISQTAKSIGVPTRTAYDQRARIWPHLTTLDKEALAVAGDLLDDLCGELVE